MSDLEGASTAIEDRVSDLESAVARPAGVIDQTAQIINAQGNMMAMQSEAIASLLRRVQDLAPGEQE